MTHILTLKTTANKQLKKKKKTWLILCRRKLNPSILTTKHKSSSEVRAFLVGDLGLLVFVNFIT